MQDLKKSAAGTKRSNKIYKLDPVLTNDGLLVCRMRSRGFCDKETAHAPPILPKKHHVSILLARHYHENSGHSGREYMVAELWQKCFIQGSRGIVRQLISNCVTCRRLFAEPEKQRMGDLPSESIAVGELPFTQVGVDCFGPFTTRSGRKLNNRYG